MRKNSKHQSFAQTGGRLTNMKYTLSRILSELWSRYQENFNPDWREPLPPKKCEFCGKTGHLEAYCPNAKGLGFLD